MLTTELRAEWAAQRIKGLSFISAAKSAFFGNKGNKIKSLIASSTTRASARGRCGRRCPTRSSPRRRGPPQTPVEEIEVRDGRVIAIIAGGERIEPGEVISSLPLRATVGLAGAAAARGPGGRQGLRYRDFLTVALVIDGEDLFPDNWIYIHEPSVQVGRIQNFRSWSPSMVPDESKACVGMEYFCIAGDDLWEPDDDELVELAKRELEELGLADPEKVERGFVTRVPKAYPMYDADYSERVDAIRDSLEGIANLQQVGRNGLHRYNNSDHSMLTAIRAVENIHERHRATTSGPSTRVRLPRGRRQGRAAVHGLPRRVDGGAARLLGGLSVQPSVWTDVRCPGSRCVGTLEPAWRAIGQPQHGLPHGRISRMTEAAALPGPPLLFARPASRA